jgi:predicted amidophosphoribosyltransferase
MHHKSPKCISYAGPTTCLRCDEVFESWDRRQNRLCPRCREAIDQQPSDKPRYSFPRPLRRLREVDDW